MNIASVIGAVASLSWLLVIGAVAITVVRASRGSGTKGGATMIVIAIILALVLTTVSRGLVFVPPQDRGVIISALQRGGVRGQLDGGLNWVVPYFDTVVTYPMSRQTYTISTSDFEGQSGGASSVEARTSDGQIVFVDASVIYAINPSHVIDIHLNWQNRYAEGLVLPVARGVIRDAVSAYGVEEVYSAKRAELEARITTDMATKFDREGLILVDFVLRNIAFSTEYADSVEQKQIAEQLAQQAVFVVEQRRQEAEQARQTAQGQADAVAIRAEGDARAVLIAAQAQAEARLIQAQAEAEALRMLAEAIKDNPDILTLQYIEKLAPNISVMLLPADNPFLFPLPQIGPPALETPVVIPTPLPTTEPTQTAP